jgi:hypothetical protein
MPAKVKTLLSYSLARSIFGDYWVGVGSLPVDNKVTFLTLKEAINEGRERIRDQFYDRSEGELDDMCFEFEQESAEPQVLREPLLKFVLKK